MKLQNLDSQTRKVVNEINDELTKVEGQRELLVDKPVLLKSLYRFSIECMADPEMAKSELEGFKPSARGKNPYHAPVKYQLQNTKFGAADMTHFGVIFNDAHHRGIAVSDIVKELRRFGTKLKWYEQVKDEVRCRYLGMKEHTASKIRKLNAKGGRVDIRQGDCLAILKSLPDASVDAVVTDPPYGIGLHDCDWDTAENAKKLWVEVYVECKRVLKEGGHLVAFCSPKTYHRMTTVIEDLGFIIKDMIGRAYFTGFPKERYGLKPALEPIVVAVKGSGKFNVDACRTPYADGEKVTYLTNRQFIRGETQELVHGNPNGRHPMNLCGDLSEDNVKQQKLLVSPRAQSWERHIGFEYMPECERVNGELYTKDHRTPQTAMADHDWIDEHGNPKWNNHYCVKPMELMGWLIKLVTKPGQTVLDPFAGSGSTGLGCLLTGRNFIGLELDERYFKVAEIRLNFFMDQINDKKQIAYLDRWLKDPSELVKKPANRSEDKAAA